MATLSDTALRELWADLMRELSAARTVLNLSKTELRAAVDATDQWIDDNAAAFNAALPLPARTELTAKQKVRLFMLVAAKRYGVL